MKRIWDLWSLGNPTFTLLVKQLVALFQHLEEVTTITTRDRRGTKQMLQQGGARTLGHW